MARLSPSQIRSKLSQAKSKLQAAQSQLNRAQRDLQSKLNRAQHQLRSIQIRLQRDRQELQRQLAQLSNAGYEEVVIFEVEWTTLEPWQQKEILQEAEDRGLSVRIADR